MNNIPEKPHCPRCGSKRQVIRMAINIEYGCPAMQRLFCNFCNYEWIDEVEGPDESDFFDRYVKHGHWDKMSESIGYICSCCGKEMYCCSVREPENLPKYCSNCGAKMDLGY